LPQATNPFTTDRVIPAEAGNSVASAISLQGELGPGVARLVRAVAITQAGKQSSPLSRG